MLVTGGPRRMDNQEGGKMSYDEYNGIVEGFRRLAEAGKTLGVRTFSTDVEHTLSQIEDMLIQKNQAYGNSALDPVRVFSKMDTKEQLLVRIDDKLSRIARGSTFPGEDTIDDLIGYLVLLKIAMKEEV